MGELLSLLDMEFVFAKGRSGSLAERLPHVFTPGARADTYVTRECGAARASVTVKWFRWFAGEWWQAAMIGLVYTHPESRGKGFASEVMRAVESDLRARGTDYGVLWTGLPAFYRRLGWISADSGQLGEAQGEALTGPDLSRLDASTVDWMGDLCERWQAPRVERSREGFLARPLPAVAVDLYAHHQDPAGYMLVGRAASTGYVYEFVGDPAAFDGIWREVQRSYRRILINDHARGLLRARVAATWKAQQLAMWLPLSRRAEKARAPIESWSIPYLDRI
jgi:predicted N-acetyltransferase YhbS